MGKRQDPGANICSINTGAQRLNLTYLDGVRGICALYVLLYHVWQFVVTRADFAELPSAFRVVHLLKYGHLATCTFVVMSGYCLMLPVVRSESRCLTGGLKTFLRRRAQRILPAYYPALALSMLLVWAMPVLQQVSGTQWDFALPALTPRSVLSHILLVHNLSSTLRYKIDPPLWSIALEFQIYFVFALVLLPVWKRFGTLPMLGVAFLIGLLPLCRGMDYAYPWFVGLFALGMAGAVISFDPTLPAAHPARTAPWGVLSGLVWLLVGLGVAIRHGEHSPVLDILVGVATASFLIAYTAQRQSKPSVEQRPAILEMRWPVALGRFSYSLCLIHYPLIAAFNALLTYAHCSTAVAVVTLFGVGVPFIVAASYLFHLVCERPFLRNGVSMPTTFVGMRSPLRLSFAVRLAALIGVLYFLPGAQEPFLAVFGGFGYGEGQQLKALRKSGLPQLSMLGGRLPF